MFIDLVAPFEEPSPTVSLSMISFPLVCKRLKTTECHCPSWYAFSLTISEDPDPQLNP